MKHVWIYILLVLIVLSQPVLAKSPDTILDDAVLVLQEISEQPDAESMAYLLKNAYGVAIFPEVIRVGLGLGGRYGEGLILRRDPQTNTWYGPYFADIKGLSYGLQIGIQSTSLVLVIANERGVQNLTEGTVTLGGSLSIAAGPVGRSAEAGTDLKLAASIYSYSMSKGAFAGMSLEGAVISNNSGSNHLYWQDELTPKTMLDKRASKNDVRPLTRLLNEIITDAESI